MAETSNAEFIKRKRDAIADITNYDSIADLVVKDLLDAFTRLEQADKKIDSLYDLNALTRTIKEQAGRIEQQQKCIRELMRPAKGFEQIAELCGATMGPTRQIIAKAEELLKE